MGVVLATGFAEVGSFECMKAASGKRSNISEGKRVLDCQWSLQNQLLQQVSCLQLQPSCRHIARELCFIDAHVAVAVRH